jgi:hypothetical protein
MIMRHLSPLTAQYKLQVLAEIGRAPAGSTGAILRREGLYSSGLTAFAVSDDHARQEKVVEQMPRHTDRENRRGI